MTALEATREVVIPAASVSLRAEIDLPRADDPDASNRPAILVLHGFTGSAESMACVARGIAGTRPVIRLELVGHGGSAAPTDPALYTMAACVEQIQAAVAWLSEAEGFSRPHLLGYSMGGRAALATAIAHPDLFASLSLVGATAGIADASLRAERIAADEALAESILRDGLEAFVDRWMALPLFASQASLGTEALALARRQRLQNRPEALAASLRGMGAGAQRPLHDELERVRSRVLLVVGEQDAKFRAIASQLERDLARAEVAVIAGVGHAAHLEDPLAFARVLEPFLARVESEGADASRPEETQAGALGTDGAAGRMDSAAAGGESR